MSDGALSHEEEDHKKSGAKHAGIFDIYILGITIVIGGQIFSWNVGLAGGLWEAFVAMVVTGIGFLFLVLCLSEMTSALPFSGGSYGFVRVCLGPFFGYLVGCCETLEFIAYVISAVIPFGEMLTPLFNAPVKYEPIYWTFFFVTAVGINVIGGKLFWTFNRIIGTVSLLLILIYIASTIQYCDFSKHAEAPTTFDGGNFLTFLPLATWWYIGVEALPLACVDCEKPQIQIPIGMTLCIVTLICTAFAVFFTTTSQPPGTAALAEALLPLNFGYQRVFGMSDTLVGWFAIPATYATGFGFMWVYGRQMCSMARSGLFPSIFKLRTGTAQTPYTALLFGSLIAVAGVVSIYYTELTLLTNIFNICVISSYTIYISVFISYIVFKYRYSGVQRKFNNPFGIPSAIIGICVYAMGLVSVIGYQGPNQASLIVFVCYVFLITLYYYFYGYKTQKLSEEEHKVLFKAYVINANLMNRLRRPSDLRNSNRTSKASKGSSRSAPVVSKFKNLFKIGESEAENVSLSGKSKALVAQAQLRMKNNAIAPEPDELSHQTVEDHAHRLVTVEHSPAQDSTVIENGLSNSHEHNHQKDEVSESVRHAAEVEHDHGNSTKRRRSQLLRSSFLGSISEKVKEIAHEMKIVPFMDEEERKEYENLVIAECQGQFDDDKLVRSVKEQANDLVVQDV